MPFVVAKNPVVQINLVEALLAALSARPAAALLNAPKLLLYKAGPSAPGPNQLIGDFTVCDFDGYATVTLTALVGPIGLLNQGEGVHVEADFASANPQTKPQSAIGYVIADTALAIVYVAEGFENPIPIAKAGDFISLDAVIGIDYRPAVATS